MRFTIRQTNDRDAVFKMDNEMFPGCRNLQDMENPHLWLAWHKGERVGYCATIVSDGFIFMARSAVLPEFRGHGLQKRMLAVREKFHGAGLYITYTRRSNPASMNSLIGCGYRAYWPEWRYAGREMVYWCKEEI